MRTQSRPRNLYHFPTALTATVSLEKYGLIENYAGYFIHVYPITLSDLKTIYKSSCVAGLQFLV